MEGGVILPKGREKGMNIAKNIGLIEWLKSELLSSVSDLFTLLTNGIKGTQEAIIDCLANIILVSYLLGRRLGIHYGEIDKRMGEKIRLGILDEHDVESEYGDLSMLSEYFRQTRE